MHINTIKSEHDPLKSELVTLGQAFNIVSKNYQTSCIWVPAKTSKGCYVDVCGRKLENEQLIKVSVPTKDELTNEWDIYSNGHIRTSFDISIEYIEHDTEWFALLNIPNYVFNLGNRFKSLEEFFNYIDNKEDLNTMTIKTEPIYQTVITGYKVINF